MSNPTLPAPGQTPAPPTAAEAPLGRLGPYRLLRRLGQGGMGTVYEAEDEQLGRRVALKVIRADRAHDALFRERFLNETRSAAKLQSDHVVPLFHAGVEGGTPFLAMPLLAGETLADRLDRGPLRPDEVMELGRQVALGLAAAHAAGLVHRDVKPANIWLEPVAGGRPRARLLDFGLARAHDATDLLTAPGVAVGTPAYMAPEQARGKPVDARADLYSLGVVLHEALTGARPPHGDRAGPPALAELIAELLRAKPAERPGSAAGVAGRLVAQPAPERSHGRLIAATLLAGAGGGLLVVTAATRSTPAAPTRPAPAVAAVAAPPTRPAAPPTVPAPVERRRPTDADVRRAAEHVFRRGGGVYAGASGYVRDAAKLPAKPFEVGQAMFHNKGTLTAADADALADLNGLDELYLSGTKVPPELLPRLLGVPGRPLSRLELTDTGLTSAHLAAVADAEPQLHHLHVDYFRGDAAGFAPVGRLHALTELHLNNTAASDAVVAAWRLPRLKLLGATGCAGLTDAAFAGAAERFPELDTLWVEGTGVTAAGVRSFAAAFPRLATFGTSARDAGDDELAALAARPLVNLKMAAGRVTGRGLQALRGGPLAKLTLVRQPLADAHLAALADLPALESVTLRDCPGVGDAALEHLTGLTRLRTVDVRGTAVTAEAAKRFAAKRPKCRVEWTGGAAGK